jgi:hypothetical protein
VNDLRRGSGKSRQGAIAVLCRGRERRGMKTNQYRGDCELLSVPYSASDTVDRTGQGRELDRVRHSRFLTVRNSPSGAVAAAIARRRPIPLRTLIVCFTIWLIATQAMIFDQVKFDQRAHLIEQASRSLGGPPVIVPNERPSNLPSVAKVQRL